MIRVRRTVAVASTLVALASVLTAGCSNTKSAATRQPYSGTATASVVDGVQQVTLTVGPSFRFDPSTITVHPGPVKLTLRHTGTGSPHDWQLSVVPGAYIPELGDNETRSVSFTAPAPGKYQFVCTIHLRQGQTGTLIVLPR